MSPVQQNFAIIERRAGSLVASFDDEAEAREWARANVEQGDEWALCRFGKEPSDNELLVTWGPTLTIPLSGRDPLT